MLKEKNKIGKIFTIVGLVALLTFLMTGCNDEPTTDKSKVETGKEAGEFIDILEQESESFTLTNNDLIKMLDENIKQEEDGFPLIDQMLYNIDLRGYKYEELLSTLSESITIDEEAIKNKEYDKITDRILKDLIKEIEADGYELIFKDQYVMLHYDVPKLIDKYKDSLPKDYAEAKLKLNKYGLLNVREELPKSEDSEDEIPQYKLKFDEIGKIVVDLDSTIVTTKYEPLQAEIEEVILYYISLMTGLVDQNLVLVDAETLDPDMLKTFTYISKNTTTPALTKLSLSIIDNIKEEKGLTKSFLDKTVMAIYNYIDENKSDIYNLDEYKESMPEEEQVEIKDGLDADTDDIQEEKEEKVQEIKETKKTNETKETKEVKETNKTDDSKKDKDTKDSKNTKDNK